MLVTEESKVHGTTIFAIRHLAGGRHAKIRETANVQVCQTSGHFCDFEMTLRIFPFRDFSIPALMNDDEKSHCCRCLAY